MFKGLVILFGSDTNIKGRRVLGKQNLSRSGHLSRRQHTELLEMWLLMSSASNSAGTQITSSRSDDLFLTIASTPSGPINGNRLPKDVYYFIGDKNLSHQSANT